MASSPLPTVTSDPIQVFVPGHPRAQGSKKLVGRHLVEMAKDLQPWKHAIAARVSAERGERKMFGPIGVRAVFFFNRPKSHYGTGSRAGFVKNSAPRWRESAPDVDKLVRALLDALTMSGLILDDRYVVSVSADKVYGDPGVLIEVKELE